MLATSIHVPESEKAPPPYRSVDVESATFYAN